MVYGICDTEEKYRKSRWPREFSSVPEIGDYVQSREGDILEVKSITHFSGYRIQRGDSIERSKKIYCPMIRVELIEVEEIIDNSEEKNYV